MRGRTFVHPSLSIDGYPPARPANGRSDQVIDIGPARARKAAAWSPPARPRHTSTDSGFLMSNLEDGGRGEAGEAIRAARAGRLPMEQMLRSVLAAQVIVPLADLPVMDGARMLSWKPATVSRDADGEQFVVVFTDETLDGQYARWRPEYPYRLRVGADWLITVLPAGHGIIFNLGGGENMFEWPARGILAHRADHET